MPERTDTKFPGEVKLNTFGNESVFQTALFTGYWLKTAEANKEGNIKCTSVDKTGKPTDPAHYQFMSPETGVRLVDPNETQHL